MKIKVENQFQKSIKNTRFKNRVQFKISSVCKAFYSDSYLLFSIATVIDIVIAIVTDIDFDFAIYIGIDFITFTK